MSTSDKFVQMVIAVAIFYVVIGAILLLTQRLRSRAGERVQTAAFLGPSVLLICIGLLYPAIVTVWQSLHGASSFDPPWVGLDNYKKLFTDKQQLTVLRNTLLWVILTPIVSTGIGLVYAVLVDRIRFERIAKALMFLPIAISMVAASIIWKFVYAYRSGEADQIGLLNQILVWLHVDPYNFLLNDPWNTFFLIVILIWIQAGFAMTILSASIKAIPDDIVEAARLDGVGGWKMFRFITVPSIRPSLIVVLTTITIATLKVFDIVQTATGGNFNTSVLAYEFYRQNFIAGNQGIATAIAVVIFALVIPVVIYNIRQMRKLEAR
ncbi:sugar ABC transporter permease [Nocardioides sp. LMS-CY]|uniref:Alpha-glucoside transport system permease protein n=1 Tax=Nocardioides soli TaxID=1036020 RepID=A0A7W4VVA5_9ACTN|nr:sugar ABC transporter permease [Nocardioides sp. LMS-CY]MBB3042059.1 alpha-glucoside transport system permease protein [Nocardioides soli]QWF21538.1 sugar ABC transporter permease [Nocardioides sp. LMS-CY]